MRGKAGSMDGVLGQESAAQAAQDFPANSQPQADFDTPIDWNPSSFYVPGERHENLPINTFAGHRKLLRSLGAPVQTLIPDQRPAEYATGGSGMFQGADFGHGKLIALHGPGRGMRGVSFTRNAMGQDDSSDDSSSNPNLLSQFLTTTGDVAQALSPVQTAQAATAPKPAVAAPSTGFMSKKVAGIPMVAVLLAVAGAGAFYYMRKKK
jgi:hypothetical protein